MHARRRELHPGQDAEIARRAVIGFLERIQRNFLAKWHDPCPKIYLPSGNRTVNTVPRGFSCRLRTKIWPPCSVMMRLTSASPSPLPSVPRALVPRYSSSKILGRSSDWIPAPESAHAIRTAIDEALKAKEAGEKKVILFNLSGHGHFDMAGYQKYFAGQLEDYEHPQEEIEKAIAGLPKVTA